MRETISCNSQSERELEREGEGERRERARGRARGRERKEHHLVPFIVEKQIETRLRDTTISREPSLR